MNTTMHDIANHEPSTVSRAATTQTVRGTRGWRRTMRMIGRVVRAAVLVLASTTLVAGRGRKHASRHTIRRSAHWWILAATGCT
jgi:lipoate synthase